MMLSTSFVAVRMLASTEVIFERSFKAALAFFVTASSCLLIAAICWLSSSTAKARS